MMYKIFFLTMSIVLVMVAEPCLAQFEVAYDINIGDEAPYIAIDDSGYVFATYRQDWSIVVAKLDSLGDTLWTRIHCNGVACNPHDIALDGNGNVYVVGPADQLFNDTAMGDCNLDLIPSFIRFSAGPSVPRPREWRCVSGSWESVVSDH